LFPEERRGVISVLVGKHDGSSGSGMREALTGLIWLRIGTGAELL